MPIEITATLAEWYSGYSSSDLMLASLGTSPGACSICSNMLEAYTRSVEHLQPNLRVGVA